MYKYNNFVQDMNLQEVSIIENVIQVKRLWSSMVAMVA
jgi:hypothetical protein